MKLSQNNISQEIDSDARRELNNFSQTQTFMGLGFIVH